MHKHVEGRGGDGKVKEGTNAVYNIFCFKKERSLRSEKGQDA